MKKYREPECTTEKCVDENRTYFHAGVEPNSSLSPLMSTSKADFNVVKSFLAIFSSSMTISLTPFVTKTRLTGGACL